MNRFLRIESLRMLLFALIVGTMFAGIVSAQTKNNVSELTEGTEYYFAIPHCAKEPAEGARGAASVELWVSSKKTTKVFGRCNGLGTTFQANISPNKVRKIALSDDYMNTINETVQNLGVHLTSTEPISLTVFVSYRWSGEAYRVIPAVWLGKSYRTLNLYQDETDEIKPSQIVITATQDKTSITYVPSCNTQKVKKGKIGQITLNKGQTFLIHNEKRSSYTHIDGDLTGTLITADKPIAVISGHTKGAFPRYSKQMFGRPANFMRNMLIDMLLPEELLGTEYVSAPILYTYRYVRNIDPDDVGDLIRFVAIKDKTIIQQMLQDGTGYKTVSKSLKAGEYFELTNMELSAAYKSNFPVLVGQYGKAWRNQFITMDIDKGENPDNPSRNGCGMMMVLVPKERWCSYAVFNSPNGLDNFMYMTFRAADENALTFDNVPLRTKFGVGIKAVPGTEYSYVAAQISAGDHTIEGAPFAAYAYGNWDYTKDGFAYGYPIGLNMATPCDDSLLLEEVEYSCGNIKGTATALPDSLECAKLFAIEMITDSSSNYIFKSNNNFDTIGNKGTFELQVEDIRMPAKAVIRVTSKSGKVYHRKITYLPESIRDSIMFDNITSKCGTITGKVHVLSEIKECSMLDTLTLDSNLSKNFSLRTERINESSTNYTLRIIDSTKQGIAILRAIPLSGKMKSFNFNYEPEKLLVDTSSLMFNVYKVGDTVCHKLTLANNGNTNVTVTKMSLGNDTKPFFVKTQLPIEIKVEDSIKVEICTVGLESAQSFSTALILNSECSSFIAATLKLNKVVTDLPYDGEGISPKFWLFEDRLFAKVESTDATEHFVLSISNCLGKTVYHNRAVTKAELMNGLVLDVEYGIYYVTVSSTQQKMRGSYIVLKAD